MFGVSLFPLEAEPLETVRAIHSFIERSAILLFAGVVACDTILHFLGDRHPLDTTIKWNKRKLALRWNDRLYEATLPGYSGRFSPKAIVKILSLVWFAAAIFLELVALPYSERVDKLADDELAFSAKQTRTALIQATRATGLAGNISDRADELAALLKTEQETTARFQKQATESENELAATAARLDTQVKQQGPRWALLRPAIPELVRALLLFAGQRVAIYVSGPQAPVLTDEEKISTWGVFAEFLDSNHAKWKVEKGGLIWAEREVRFPGIKVYVSTKASPTTADAARALASELTKLLPLSPGDVFLAPEDPDSFVNVLALNPAFIEEPYVVAARDPDLVVIMVGTHPQR